MLLHEKYMTIGTIISAILAIIGTIAALSYYLSLTRYSGTTGFIALFSSYLILLIGAYSFFSRRLEKNVRRF